MRTKIRVLFFSKSPDMYTFLTYGTLGRYILLNTIISSCIFTFKEEENRLFLKSKDTVQARSLKYMGDMQILYLASGSS